MLYVAEVSRNELRITMSSSLGFVKDFIDDVSEYVQKREIPVDEFSFKFAITEAITNAIEHGNKANTRLIAKFSLSFDNDSLRMIFEDEGTGFNWRKYKDAACPASTSVSGRGLFIIRQCGYDIEFNDTGSRLALTYPLGACVQNTI